MNAAPNWLQAAKALAEILQAENTALLATDLNAAAALLPAKRAAIEVFESLTPEGSRTEQRATIRQLDLLAAQNRKLLGHGIAIQSQILGIIAGAAQAAAARAATALGYGRRGKSTARDSAFTLYTKA